MTTDDRGRRRRRDTAKAAGTAAPLTGRVALVTGAGRRQAIGAAIVRRLAADGARVVVHSWSPHDAEQPWGADVGGADALVAEVEAMGGAAVHVPADFLDPSAPAAVVAAAVAAFGHVDILVAAHGRSSGQTLEELTAAEIDASHAVNTRGSLLLAQAFAAQHTAAEGGRILLFTSGQDGRAMPGELPYVATKASLQGLTASLAVHLAPRRITVNCLDPGPNDTGYADAATRAAVVDASPGGRWSTPADTAKLVAWLVGDEADWITGQVIASDGGWRAR